MSAAEQAVVNSVQRIVVAERVARTRHSIPPLRMAATQLSREQALNGGSPKLPGSPSNPEASANRSRI
jgi:hypothetical protein